MSQAHRYFELSLLEAHNLRIGFKRRLGWLTILIISHKTHGFHESINSTLGRIVMLPLEEGGHELSHHGLFVLPWFCTVQDPLHILSITCIPILRTKAGLSCVLSCLLF